MRVFDGEMKNNTSKNRILTYVRMILLSCVFVLLFGTSKMAAYSAAPIHYSNHVIFTAPSAEKIFDGTPLTEQIDVTVQGMPEGFTYKAVAEGSVTYPEDNAENNNIVTDYIIYDPSGLNVTEKFINVETRPGTLRVSYAESDVLGARRDAEGNEVVLEDASEDTEEQVVEIEEEEAPKSHGLSDGSQKEFREGFSLEAVIYGILFVIMLSVFVVFIMDSNRVRVE